MIQRKQKDLFPIILNNYTQYKNQKLSNVKILLILIFVFFFINSTHSLTFTPQQLDDIHLYPPVWQELPSNYLQTQVGQVPLHPLVIYPQLYFSPTDDSDIYRNIKKILRIASYYFYKVISVQTIKPSNQTIYGYYYPNGTFHNYSNCNGFTIPQKYKLQGFNPQLIDLVIFVQKISGNTKSAICMIQRRPIYALYSINQQKYSDLSTFLFHNSVSRAIHDFFHILGFNPLLFNDRMVVNSKTTYYQDSYAQILWNQFSPSKSIKTSFYQDPYSPDFIVQTNAIKISPFSDYQYMIILPRVKKWFQQIFGCSRQDLKIYNKFLDDQIGPLLFSGFYSPDYQGAYSCHYCSLNHWDIYINHDIMSVGNFDKDQVQTKILPINLIFLQDTGYYQQVAIAQADQIQLSLKNKNCSYLSSITYKELCFDAQALECDSLGLKSQSRIFNFDQTRTQFCSYTIHHCQQYSQKKRCFNTWTTNFPNYCLTSQCTGSGQNLHIKLITQSLQVQGCYQGQTSLYIHRLQRYIQCPKNIKTFCSVNYCDDYCNYQGYCINNQCIIPPTTFLSHLIENNQIYDTIFQVVSEQNVTLLCPLGCSNCSWNSFSYGLQYTCYDTFPGYSKQKLSTQTDQYIRFCRFGCYSCLNNDQFCYGCFKNYFWNPSTHYCYSCDQTCSACTVGDNLALLQCTNCQQGQYIDFQGRCVSCQIQHCLKCQRQSLKCSVCNDGYSIGKNGYQCVQCLSGCSKCDQNNILTCIGCRSGYYQLPSTQQCISCSLGCEICQSEQLCNVCYSNWFLNSQKSCQIKCKRPCITCKSTNQSQCLSCGLGYKLNNQTEQCQADLSCSELNTCGFCPDTYILNKVYKNCTQCLVENCGQCSINTLSLCDKCLSGYYLNEYRLCVQCAQGCQQCAQKNVCTKCKDGYSNPKNIDGTVFKEKCIACKGNCMLCPSNPNECLLCNDNYKKLGWKCVPQKHINYTITVFYERTLKYFIQTIQYQNFQIALRQAMSIPNQYQNTFINISEGSIVIRGQIGYNQSLKQEAQCKIYTKFARQLQQGSNIQGYKVIAVQLSASNNVCYSYPLYNEIVITQYVVGIDVGIILIVVAGLLLITTIIILIIGWRSRDRIRKLILRFEEIKSRPQYQSTIKEKEAI